MVKQAATNHPASGIAPPQPIQVMVFTVGEVVCALPLHEVERVSGMVAMAPLPRSGAIAQGVVAVAGEAVPVIDIGARLGQPERAPRLSDFLILVRTRQRRLALRADGVAGIDRLSFTAPADPVLYGGKPIAGLALLEGAPVVIYDLDRFLTPAEDAILAEALGA
jgi:purine-binding chemotaxis protein CheW